MLEYATYLKISEMFPDVFRCLPDFYSPTQGFIEVKMGYRKKDGEVSILNTGTCRGQFNSFPKPFTLVIFDRETGELLEVRKIDG